MSLYDVSDRNKDKLRYNRKTLRYEMQMNVMRRNDDAMKFHGRQQKNSKNFLFRSMLRQILFFLINSLISYCLYLGLITALTILEDIVPAGYFLIVYPVRGFGVGIRKFL